MPTMNVSLTDEMVKFVEMQVAGGDYVSASEVVRDALRVLKHEREMEAEELRILREEIQIGIDAADRGEFSERTLEDMFQAALRENGL
ncbi:MAG: type II toxin-antitoxin system ParD family antitoxin [Rhizobiaceae bacterium]